jgi:hypothetical protein
VAVAGTAGQSSSLPIPAPAVGVGLAGSETLTRETAGALLAGAQPGANQDALDRVFS